MEVFGLIALALFVMILFSFFAAIKLLNKNAKLQAKLQSLESRLLKLETQVFKPVAAPVQQTVREEKPEIFRMEIFPMEATPTPPIVKKIEPPAPKARQLNPNIGVASRNNLWIIGPVSWVP